MAATNWWLAMGRDLTLLWFEAGEVVLRRSARIMRGGPSGSAEAQLMVSEKLEAVFELQRQLAAGQLGATKQQAARAVLSHVRRKVRANRSRLRRHGSA